MASPVWAYSAALSRWEALSVGGGAVLPVGDADWTLTAGVSSAVLEVLTPPVAGGVEYRVDGGSPVALPGDGSGSHTIPSLPAGVPIDVQLRAVYPSAWGAEKSATPTAPAVSLIQQTAIIDFRGSGAVGNYTAVLPFDSPSTEGSTLVVHASNGFFQTLTLADSAGGSVAGGQWTLETDGDPLGGNSGRQYTWVRRNAPAGLTSVTLTNSSEYFTARIYMAELSGLPYGSTIQMLSGVAIASQTALAVAAPGAGFLSVLVRQNPPVTPVSASAGSTVRRYDAGGYSGTVSEHWLHGIATGARSFNSSWPDGSVTVGYHGIFIPA